jgi:hypothetical protein
LDPSSTPHCTQADIVYSFTANTRILPSASSYVATGTTFTASAREFKINSINTADLGTYTITLEGVITAPLSTDGSNNKAQTQTFDLVIKNCPMTTDAITVTSSETTFNTPSINYFVKSGINNYSTKIPQFSVTGSTHCQ